MPRRFHRHDVIDDATYQVEVLVGDNGEATVNLAASDASSRRAHGIVRGPVVELGVLAGLLGQVLAEVRHPTGGRSGQKRHFASYTRWTAVDEADLVRRFEQGQPLAEIATALGRQPSAIRSRLRKLGKLPASEPDR